MQRVIQKEKYNASRTIIDGDSTLVIDRNSGMGRVVTSDTTTHHTSTRGHYKHHQGSKTPQDFARYRKTMKSSLFNNYENNDPRVRFLTLTFSDNRIKTINGAKQKFDSYVKGLEQEREVECYTCCPEYNADHQPHLHVLIKLAEVTKVERVNENVISNWLISEWSYGLATASMVWDIKGLTNYLIPSYDKEDYTAVNQELEPDQTAMELATMNHHEKKSQLKRATSSTWAKAYANKQRQQANRKKKKELQKQLKGTERAIYLSRGQAKTARVKTDNKAIHQLWKTAGAFAGSVTITTTVNTYDDNTGELIKSYERKTTIDKYYFTLKQSAYLYELLCDEIAKSAKQEGVTTNHVA